MWGQTRYVRERTDGPASTQTEYRRPPCCGSIFAATVPEGVLLCLEPFCLSFSCFC